MLFGAIPVRHPPLRVVRDLMLVLTCVPNQVIYQDNRGWNSLVGALPFLGVLVSMFLFEPCNQQLTYRLFEYRWDVSSQPVGLASSSSCDCV
jgi:hypothetical protein